MQSREMTYDFKIKANKGDSNQRRNWSQPQIDWFLNEGQELFIKRIAQPRKYDGRGFETNQRSIDDIRTIVNNPLSFGNVTDRFDNSLCIHHTGMIIYIMPPHMYEPTRELAQEEA